MTLTALVVCFSPGGNTLKVARAVEQGFVGRGVDTTVVSLKEAGDCDLEDYDVVCLGAPAYNFCVPEPVLRYSKAQLRRHSDSVHLGAPTRPGRWGVVFVTYGGPHTGIAEATPAGDHLAQMLAHLGRQVRAVWYTVGEFHGKDRLSTNTLGFLGDIRGRPNEHDLGVIEANAAGLAYVLSHEKERLGL